MCFIGVEVEQETSAPPPKKNPGSAPVIRSICLEPVRLEKVKHRDLSFLKIYNVKMSTFDTFI